MCNDMQNFYDAVLKSNAEELKNRILKKFEEAAQKTGLSKEKISRISIDISDYYKDQKIE